ncbi:terminase small subunit protein [Rhizobium phage RHph_I65]|nr:terminase small subunit protein [Rhizobium phage RHph_I65]
MAVKKQKGAARDPKRRAAIAKAAKERVAKPYSPGTKMWECRSKMGPRYLYSGEEGAEQLWNELLSYLEWCEANPLYEGKLISFQGVGTVEEVPKMRIATLGGFCLHLGIAQTTYMDWRKREDLCNVIANIDAALYEYKIAGASADLLNANIISRLLGLADKTELTGPGGGPVQSITGNMSAKEAADLYAQTRDKGKK